jgi:hypothetical protein
MLAAGKSSLVSHLQSHGRAASSLMIGRVRTLFVPYGAGSRRRINQSFSAAAVKKRSGGKPRVDIASAMPLSPQGNCPYTEGRKKGRSMGLLAFSFSFWFYLTLSSSSIFKISRAVTEMDNATIVTLGEMGNAQAREEILKRHVMMIDKVSYEESSEKVEEIAASNRKGMFLLSLPYQIGIAASLTAGFASIPLCFHLPTAEWFNMYYVTTDVPEPKDLETALEVGAWTWNWMEPPLGQISFLLLCLQFSRSQIENLGVKPYTSKVKEWRANRLAEAYPQYDQGVIKNFSLSARISNHA